MSVESLIYRGMWNVEDACQSSASNELKLTNYSFKSAKDIGAHTLGYITRTCPIFKLSVIIGFNCTWGNSCHNTALHNFFSQTLHGSLCLYQLFYFSPISALSHKMPFLFLTLHLSNFHWDSATWKHKCKIAVRVWQIRICMSSRVLS